MHIYRKTSFEPSVRPVVGRVDYFKTETKKKSVEDGIA